MLINLTVPDELHPRLLAALRAAHPEHADQPDGDLVRAAALGHLRRVLIGHETREAARAAASQARAARDAAHTAARALT